MKKILFAIILTTTVFLAAGCSNDVPDARDDISNINVKSANESVPFSEHSVKSSFSGNIEVSKKEFKNLSSIIINGNEFTLGKSTPNDVGKVFGLKPKYDKDLGCYVLKNGGYNMAMLYADKETKKLNKITLCNLDKNYNILAFDYWNVLNTSSPESVIEIFGNATTYADSLNTKNRQWNYDSPDDGKRISFQMIWTNDKATQIEINNTDI